MSSIVNFKKRVGSGNVTGTKTRLIADARKNFERSLKRDPCAVYTKITDVGEVNISDTTKFVSCIINDFSENDQKSFDEKIIYVRHDENVGIGSYVEFDGFIWLIIFKEHRSTDIYKSFILRKCNQILKYTHKGVTYDIPSVVKNLTQYSDGLQDIVWTSTPDGRRSITYSTNEVTKNIKLGKRFLVNHGHVYRVTHIQDFEFQHEYGYGNGVSTCIAVHTSLLNEDDRENNKAHNDGDDFSTDISIIGNSTLMVGTKGGYSISNGSTCEWNIVYTSNKLDYIKVSTVENRCILESLPNFDLVGETFKLIAYDKNNLPILEKNITLVGFM